MTGGKNKPPIGKAWFWITLELIESDAWHSQNFNTRRLLDFLVREHMRHGGTENGLLKAPQHQLELFGIGARYVAAAIAQADELGLVDVQRNGMRAASTYTLTWLPTHDGEPATDRWRSYRNPGLRPLPTPKPENLPLKGKVGLPLKGKVDGANLPLKGKADTPKSLPLKGKDLLRSSYRDRSNTLGLSGAGTLPAEHSKLLAAVDALEPGIVAQFNGTELAQEIDWWRTELIKRGASPHADGLLSSLHAALRLRHEREWEKSRGGR